jgi:hypothetical protein
MGGPYRNRALQCERGKEPKLADGKTVIGKTGKCRRRNCRKIAGDQYPSTT